MKTNILKNTICVGEWMKYDYNKIYKKFTLEEVRKTISKKYDPRNSFIRKMFIHKSNCNYGTAGCLFFALNGSPPKGYAIYVPEHKYLLVVDAWGKTTRYNECYLIDENDEMIDINTFDDTTILEKKNEKS